jgi:hypothetical protein
VIARVGQIVFHGNGQLDLSERMEVEPLLRNLKRNVRAEEADGEEERFRLRGAELGGGPIDDLVIAGFFIGTGERCGSEKICGALPEIL